MTTNMRYLRGAVVLGLLAISASTGPARAGTGPSTGCSDGPFGPPGTEVPVLTSPITLAAEAGRLDPTSSPYVQLCFSTTNTGNPNAAVGGGWIVVGFTPTDTSNPANPTNPTVTCDKDTNPIVLGVDCRLGDRTGSSPGRTLDVVIWLQGSPTPISIGAEVGTPDSLACLRSVTVTAGVTEVGPYDIGVCTP